MAELLLDFTEPKIISVNSSAITLKAVSKVLIGAAVS